MELRNEQKKIIFAALGIITVLVAGFLAQRFLFGGNAADDVAQTPAEDVLLVIRPETMEARIGNPVNFKAFFGEKDVTEEAEWYSSHDPMMFVSNTPAFKGQATPQKAGEWKVYAVYNDASAEATVKVTAPELSVSCFPLGSSGKIAEAKVGERVTWYASYDERGTPGYTYAWVGSDGKKSDQSVFETAYSVAGEKTMRFSTTDFAGKSTEVECALRITK